MSKDFSAGASAILETQKRQWSVQTGRVTQKVARSVGILGRHRGTRALSPANLAVGGHQ